MEEKKDYCPLIRTLQLFGFSGLYFLLINLILNYLMLSVKYVGLIANDPENAKKVMDFNSSYLVRPPDGMDLFMVFLITFVLAILTVLQLDTWYKINHDNKEIKGKDRFMTTKEIGKKLYSFKADEITSAEKSGIILAYEKNRFYVDTDTTHSLIIGTTRSGKGQTFVLPMMRHISYSQAKHSMVLNDPKGELLEKCYDMFAENGYNVVVLNLRDTEQSSLWNPLQIIIDEYVYAKENKKDLSKVNKLIASLAETFTYNAVSDPIWPDSAKSLLTAMILLMLQKGYENDELDKVSMYSVYQMFIDFGSKNEQHGNKLVNALDELFQQLAETDPTNPAVAAYAVSNFASGEMRSSIFSTLSSNINLFGSDEGISKLTSGNQINFKELIIPGKPMAIFMVVPDNDQSRYMIASLFVNQCYDTLVEEAKKYEEQKLPQRVHFILDEFGNMVRIPEMDTKITVGAGRNLLFDLFLQDLNQLDSKYEKEAKTIRSNCGNMIYIYSLDKDTNEYFSAIMGTRTVEYTTYSGELKTWFSHQQRAVEALPLISASELSTLPMGTAITKRQRCYPIKTRFEPFYKLGLSSRPIREIAESMELIDRPLSETIFPMEILWTPLFKPMIGKDGRKQVEMNSDGSSTPITCWNDRRKALEIQKQQRKITPGTAKGNAFSGQKPDNINEPEVSANGDIFVLDKETIIVQEFDRKVNGEFERLFRQKEWDRLVPMVRRSVNSKIITHDEADVIMDYIKKYRDK